MGDMPPPAVESPNSQSVAMMKCVRPCLKSSTSADRAVGPRVTFQMLSDGDKCERSHKIEGIHEGEGSHKGEETGSDALDTLCPPAAELAVEVSPHSQSVATSKKAGRGRR